MNSEKLLKVTYHTDTKKINKYIEYTSGYDQMLENILENCPYKHDGDVRLFWIDNEGDEIDITDQKSLSTYERFTSRVESRHLHIAIPSDDGTAKAVKAEKPCKILEVNQAKIPAAAGSRELAVHHCIICDGCGMNPIIGFRYKCMQCPDYDLCQNCESKHIHSQHMMKRMPTTSTNMPPDRPREMFEAFSCDEDNSANLKFSLNPFTRSDMAMEFSARASRRIIIIRRS